MRLDHLHESYDRLQSQNGISYEVLDTYDHQDGWTYMLCARYAREEEDTSAPYEWRTGFAWLRAKPQEGIGGRITYSDFHRLSREVDDDEPEDRLVKLFTHNKQMCDSGDRWRLTKRSDMWLIAPDIQS